MANPNWPNHEGGFDISGFNQWKKRQPASEVVVMARLVTVSTSDRTVSASRRLKKSRTPAFSRSFSIAGPPWCCCCCFSARRVNTRPPPDVPCDSRQKYKPSPPRQRNLFSPPSKGTRTTCNFWGKTRPTDLDYFVIDIFGRSHFAKKKINACSESVVIWLHTGERRLFCTVDVLLRTIRWHV